MNILHFDTFDNNSTYSNNNCYDTSFILSNPLKNIRYVYLKSLEMPIGINNIRSDNTSNIFSIVVNSITYTATLNNNNYTDINSLITDINSQYIGSNKPILSILNNIVSITVSTSSTIQITNSILSNIILGFSKNTSQTNTTIITAINRYLLAYDNYIALYLDIPSKGTSSSSKQITYKIPLNAVSGTVYYIADNNTFTQRIEMTDPNFVLLQFRIIVYDRFGYKINNGLDYTFSLGFQ